MIIIAFKCLIRSVLHIAMFFEKNFASDMKKRKWFFYIFCFSPKYGLFFIDIGLKTGKRSVSFLFCLLKAKLYQYTLSFIYC